MDFSEVSDGEMISTTQLVDEIEYASNYFSCNSEHRFLRFYIARGMRSLALIFCLYYCLLSFHKYTVS